MTPEFPDVTDPNEPDLPAPEGVPVPTYATEF
jgi:hypothetical protein